MLDHHRVHQLLDFERDIDLASRGNELGNLMRIAGIPWLDSVATKEGAKQWCERHPRSPFMAGVLRQYLDLAVAPNKSLERTREG